MLKFPIRVASIDVGSNALRFLAVEYKNRSHFNVLKQDRYQLRLGHDVFLLGRMKEKTIDSAVQGIKIFKNYLKEFSINNYKAVATSAVRESQNGEELINRARKEVGIILEKISGYGELQFIYISVKNRFRLRNEKWVLADIGGGSVDVSLIDKKKILWSESLKIGAIRLLPELHAATEDPEYLRRHIEKQIQSLHIPARADNKKPAGFIATGGNIETIARLLNPSDGISRVSLKDLRELTKKLENLSYRDRIQEFDLEDDRADVILPAACVYERLAILSGAEEVIIPHAELREGIVLYLIDKLWHRKKMCARA
ncbi:MAG: hypothetical protein JSV25_03325 [Spirochaetota bacterium]|nr:MAG: hypothetical protein JSV25_03325 [Spirochaetota bacterium]